MNKRDANSFWQFAGGFVDVTPTLPLPLAGYAARRHKVFTAVVDRLEANAVVLRHGTRKIALLQLDALSAGDVLRDRILDGLRGTITDAELWLVASHTHFAPALDPRLKQLGNVNDAYLADVADKVTTLLRHLIAMPGQPIYLRYGESRADHSINRRRWCWRPLLKFPPIQRVMALRPNPLGPTDETVRTLAITNTTDARTPIAALWNYACHPVSFYRARAVSADYPGAIRRALRARFGRNLPVVFLPGFCGNTRPNRIRRLGLTPYQMLDVFVNGPLFARFDRAAWNQWTDALAEVVLEALSVDNPPLPATALHCARLSRPWTDYMPGAGDERRLNCQYAALNDALTLLGVSAEVVTEYTAAVQALQPGRAVIPVSCLDGVCGYVPTTEMLAEGGLEATSPGYALDQQRYCGNIAQRLLRDISAVLHMPPERTGAS